MDTISNDRIAELQGASNPHMDLSRAEAASLLAEVAAARQGASLTQADAAEAARMLGLFAERREAQVENYTAEPTADFVRLVGPNPPMTAETRAKIERWRADAESARRITAAIAKAQGRS